MSKTAVFSPVQSETFDDIKVTYIPDGGAYINATTMYPTTSDENWDPHDYLINNKRQVVVTLGGFLIETGEKKVLMDLGYGPHIVDFPGFGPFIGGDYMKNLESTGVKPEEITDVFYTHLHVDHVGWTSMVKDGVRKLSFPNASYWCSEKEWNYWQGSQNGLGPGQEDVVEFLEGRIRFADDGQEIAPGLYAYDAPGHTPGMMILKLVAGDRIVWFTGDIFHSTVQFEENGWYAVFDIDHDTGAVTRQRMLPEFVKENAVLADGHFSDSVFGTLRVEDGKYIWKNHAE